MSETPPSPEFDLIERLARRAREAAPVADRVAVGIGDDGAVTVPDGATTTSVDMLVEGVHFRRSTSPLGLIGRKALSVALSDLAAMGADPGEAYVALGVPPDLDEAGCIELYAGLAEVASETGTVLAGGDLSASPVLTIALTVVGHGAAPERFVSRAGARPGHVLVVTGELGGAAAGLLVLERPELRSSLDEETADALVARQTNPTPRLAAGRALAAAGAAAMIDLSDGLGADARHLATAGPGWLRIELDGLPIQPAALDLAAAAGADPLDLATAAGEDYELLASLPPERISDAVAAVRPLALTVIGEVSEGSGVELRGADGGPRQPRGFDHLRSR
jgi:thiamine-monophosphate kinase